VGVGRWSVCVEQGGGEWGGVEGGGGREGGGGVWGGGWGGGVGGGGLPSFTSHSHPQYLITVQYANTEGEGLGDLVMCSYIR